MKEQNTMTDLRLETARASGMGQRDKITFANPDYPASPRLSTPESAQAISAKIAQASARLRIALAALAVYSARADARPDGTDSLRKNARAISREIAALAETLVSTLRPEWGNAGCDRCGTRDRLPGSNLCAPCANPANP